MLLYGASGHAKVIIDSLIEVDKKVVLLFDDNPNIKEIMGRRIFNHYDTSIYPDEELIVSIGDNIARKKVVENIRHKFGTVINKNAVISSNSKIDFGTVILHAVVIQSSVLIGKHVIVNTNASVDHDCFIDDFVHIGPGSTICGGVKINEGAFIGAGAVILPGIHIGNWSIIGAGAIVNKNIPDHQIWAGNPAKQIK